MHMWYAAHPIATRLDLFDLCPRKKHTMPKACPRPITSGLRVSSHVACERAILLQGEPHTLSLEKSLDPRPMINVTTPDVDTDQTTFPARLSHTLIHALIASTWPRPLLLPNPASVSSLIL